MSADLAYPFVRFAPPRHATYRAFPSLTRPQLIVPIERRAYASACQFFLRAGKGAAYSLLDRIGRFRKGTQHFGGTEALEHLMALAGGGATSAAIRIGTPGPHSKNTIVLLGRSSEPVAVAKVGTTGAARALLQREEAWLRRLCTVPGLRDCVPSVLASGEVAGSHVLVQSPVAGRRPARLGPAQGHFLAALHRMRSKHISFSDSHMAASMRQRLGRVEDTLSAAWERRAHAAYALLSDELEGRPLPMTTAHRDFTRWNMCVSREGGSVFDWEYAADEHVPLYDAFHFMLLPLALKRRVFRTDVRRVVRRAARFGGAYLDDRRSVQQASAQMLAYVLDVCLTYLESNDGREDGDVIVERYGRIIDQYEAWVR